MIDTINQLNHPGLHARPPPETTRPTVRVPYMMKEMPFEPCFMGIGD